MTEADFCDPKGAIDIAKLLAFIQLVLSFFQKQPVMAAGSHDPHDCFLDLARLNFEAAAKALEHAGHHGA